MGGLPLRHVVCPLPEHDGSTGATVVLRDDWTHPDPPWIASYYEAGVELFVADDAHAAIVEMPDRTLRLAWDGTGCTSTVIGRRVGLQGRVSGLQRFEVVWIRGCGTDADIDADDRFFMAVTAEPCTLQVMAREGGRMASGPAVEVVPRPGVDVEVVLQAPSPADLGPWKDEEYAGLLEALELSRQLMERNPDVEEYAAMVAEWEVLLADVEEARGQR